MNNIELTLIVPAFNVEKYIRQCLESILSQHYKNFEIIIVDDASKDSTREIILEYQLRDNRIKSILLDINKGPADARQIALDQALGTYIMFMDSDDRYISNFALELMVQNMKNSGADCVSCRYTTYYGKYLTIKRGPYKNGQYMTNKELAVEKLKNPNFYWHYLVIRCYKREIIVNNNIRFKSGLLVTEDMKFNNDYMFYANKFYFIKDVLYEYNCANTQSITKTKYPVSYEFYHDLFEKAKAQYSYHTNLYKDLGLYNKCKREIAAIMYINAMRLLVDFKKAAEFETLKQYIYNDKDYIECMEILGNHLGKVKLHVYIERSSNSLKYIIRCAAKRLLSL